MPGLRSVIVTEKSSDEELFSPCDPETEGLCDVPQHMPFVVISDPPSVSMLPPDTAEVLVIDVTIVVESEGTVASVLNLISSP